MLGDRRRRAARRLVAGGGVVLLAIGQVLTLVHVRPWSDYWYGVAWTGFVLAADAIIDARSGGSLVLDRPRELAAMFGASAALWWSFELANVVLLGSWTYTPSPDVPRGVQIVRSTYFFGTLVPATWQASALALSVARVRPAAAKACPSLARAAIAVGLAALVLAIAVGRALSLPFALVGIGLVVDAINMLRKRPSLLALLRARAVAPIAALIVGNVLAGVLGEMWNWPADPRWVYDAPYAGGLRLFAMPLAGYAGYAALALDLFALYHLVRPRVSGLALPDEHPLAILGTGR
jgi:hypothetical protein